MRVFALFLAGWLFSQAANPPMKFFYVHVRFDSPQEMRAIIDRGFDVGGVDHKNKLVTLVLPETELTHTRDLRVSSQVEIPERPDAQYKKPADIEAALKKAADDFPHLATIDSIGKSLEGRDIWAIKLSAHLYVPESGRKPTVLFDAMHHAREVMTPEVALDIVDYLTKNYETDEKVRNYLNELEVWVVPMVNPDGNNKVWNGSSMWRKNTRNNQGVDINRNYPAFWGSCNGSSGSPSSDTYRGASAGSEPETQALMDLVVKIKPTFNISYHSFSELVIYPYGCSPKKVPGAEGQEYMAIGKELAARLKTDSGSGGYDPGTSYELLYNVDGGSIDWMYEEYKVRSFVIEVNSSSQGFQPSYSKWRDSTVARNREGWMYILDQTLAERN